MKKSESRCGASGEGRASRRCPAVGSSWRPSALFAELFGSSSSGGVEVEAVEEEEGGEDEGWAGQRGGGGGVSDGCRAVWVAFPTSCHS